ncbi:aldehyde dehydrogenase (NADP(+)) [Nonomuraea angiospora]|uniref:NADP-dependent aldehyde dehydrogenase n=1 Tax=Nonomuraea angiospora TaxID=46172 RepID=A0ABR9MED3_9ACTN|nr:aldehyde dehydrogenase (NADP(+)) [Nonomuraea angiospora]MBE1591274.1 NADP-dependent aldehyde dehydrogenase [Nonomuraea angiospora]MDX3104370.1 aldehyde dehydrogenase (NADP(+)) [Nonomuraea angiospora]
MIYGHDPRTGETVGAALPETDSAGVDLIVSAAAAAGAAWRATPAAERALALEAVADALTAHVDELWQLADQETALGEVRLRGEVARTAGQFRLFAQVLRDGGYVEAIIDHADASLTPPRPDVRRMKHALPGVVAVFAASNFPFAFSVAGGDTASALAAGCPVVVKAHPGHPNTSERVAKIVRGALPYPDLLGLVQGMQAGIDLVQHPGVVAAGFTGSVAGGKAIQRLIDEREVPIPFYGELGSVNPVVVLPSAPAKDVATGFAGSLTLGVGQFCTNPGLMFVPEGDELRKALAEAVEGTSGGPMLAERIRDGYLGGVERLGELQLLAEGKAGEGSWAVTPKVFTADLDTFEEKLPRIAEECFGPASIVVTYREISDLRPVLERLEGSLTATVHGTDPEEAGEVVEVLGRKAGRLIWNGWPTGVAVCWAMQHGGPWPAATTTSTSVGATAIDRWLAPTAYQDWPEALLPDELKDDNPLSVPRRVDGRLEV